MSSLTVPARGNGRRLHQAWDRLSLYLPVLLMALLALGSYWLLRATPDAPVPAPARPVTHEPDYFMRRFSVKVFDARGGLKSELFGVEARHHPDTDTTEIDQARIRSISPEGLVSNATASRVVSNREQTEFLLEGDVVLVREAGRDAAGQPVPRMEFQGERLQLVTEPQRVTSDRPVRLLRGKDRLQGDTLDWRGDERVAVFSGRVRVTLVPR